MSTIADHEKSGDASVALEEVRSKAQRNFPTDCLESAASVACLFGGSSGGRADLIHVLQAGVGDVAVVDDRPAKLRQVEGIFPETWTYVCGDCLGFCSDAQEDDRRYDVVICDGSAGAVDHLWEELLPFAVNVARTWLMVRISGEYFERWGQVDEDAIRAMVGELHGFEPEIDRIIQRSSGRGGTFWVVIRPGAPVTAAAQEIADDAPVGLEGIAHGREQCVEMRDLLDHAACTAHPHCLEIVDEWRSAVERKDRQSIFRVFTSNRFAALPPGHVDRGEMTAAVFDLDRFETIDDVYAGIRTASSNGARRIGNIRKARKLGYSVRPFPHRLHVPDLHDIHFSKEVRGGKPMRAHYLNTIEEMGGAPTEMVELEPPTCPIHHEVLWGVFLDEPGHTQGTVVTDSRLTGYVHLFRYGNHCWYSRIMGHADHLTNGIMYLLHTAIVEAVLEWKRTGLRYVCYGGTRSGPRDGSLTAWKQRCLFEPRHLIYDEAGDWRGGRMTYLAASARPS
jgi:hypothetical protein